MCQVIFAIGGGHKGTVWCDVLLMDNVDILLERP